MQPFRLTRNPVVFKSGACNRNAVALLAVTAVLLITALPALAAETVASSTNTNTTTQINDQSVPIEIRLSQDLNTETVHYGDPFEGTLTKSYQFGNNVLPEGTIMRGRVEGAHPSMILGMPGYVSLDIHEAQLPDGKLYNFGAKENHPQTKKYHHPKAPTGTGIMKAAIPFSLVSAADSIPLTLATSMSTWQIFPISLAARMALGVGYELSDKSKNSPAQKYPTHTRVGYGMLRGTGLTGVYQMVTTGPEPDLRKGSVIAVNLSKAEMNQLFVAGNPASSNPNADQTANEEPKAVPITTPLPLQTLEPAGDDSQTFQSVHGKIPGKLPATPSPAPKLEEQTHSKPSPDAADPNHTSSTPTDSIAE